MAAAALSALVFLPTCGLFAPSLTGVASRPAPSLRTLEEKARAYEADLRDHHLSPEGLLLSPVRRDTKEPLGPYSHRADQAAWTGCLLAALSFRFAAGDAAAIEDVRRTLDALHLLQEVTGIPGLPARGITRAPARAPDYEPGAPGFEGYAWRADTSKDQYALVLFGYAAALASVPDPTVRERIARDAGAMADHLFGNGLEIRGQGGRRTTYGDLSPRWKGVVPNGVNAGILLLAAKVAFRASGEVRQARRYRALVEDGLPGFLSSGVFRVLGLYNPNNDNMTFLCLDGLRRLEEDARLRARYAGEVARAWRKAGGTGNALFAGISFAATGDASPREEAMEALRLFPDEKISWAVDNRDLPGLGRRFLPGSSGSPRSARPVPVHRRPMTTFLWKADPFLLVARPAAKGELEFAGVDYMLAYWMGRADGLLRPQE